MITSEQNLEIRILDADDAVAWRTLRLEALQRDPEAFSSSAEAHHKLSDKEIRSRISADLNNKFVVGAFAQGGLVGTAGFVREQGLKERHKGRVWGVYLRAGFRGRGGGRAMMDSLLERARRIDGVEQIQLSVATTQTAAAHLYRSLGFVSYGIEPGALKVGGRYVDEEYLVLRLE